MGNNKNNEPTRTTRNLKRKKVAQPRGRTSKIGKRPITKTTKPTNPKTDIFKKRFLNNSSSVTTNFRKGGRAK